MAKIIYQDKNFTIRHLSKDEFEKELPDSDEEQQVPSTDVGEDTDDDQDLEDSDDSNKTTSDALADALKRVANNQVRTNPRDLGRLHVSERKANQPAPAPSAAEAPHKNTADALAAAMERIRNQK